MPVSHLGLSVSHIPSATSFYLSALQPLGYHYIGHQGDSIGLGIKDADFFLTQEPTGAKPWPTHIAFAAASRLEVRECYAAALNAGGRPSGAPSYRNTDCTCFNAAVCDLDGNTIEVIYREGEDGAVEEASIGPSEHSRVLTRQQGVTQGSIDDAQSVGSAASRAQSRGRTVKDLASAVSRNTKRSSSAAPAVNRSEGASFSGIPVNTIVGTALGAAAGAAAVFAMCSSERANAREEAAHLEAISAKGSSRDYGRQINGTERPLTDKSSRMAIEAPPVSTMKNRRNFSTTDTQPSRPPRRNYSVTDSAPSTRRPFQPSMRTIAPGGYDDDEVQDVLSRYTLARPQPQRTATYHAIEYGPKSTYESRQRDAIAYAPVSASGRESRYTANRSTTLPDVPPPLYLEGPRSTASRRDDPRSSYEERERDLKRHDSGVSMRSYRSKHESEAGRRASRSEAGSKASTSTVKRSSKRDNYESAAGVPLPSSRADSQASTIKPSKRDKYESAAGVPLPESRAPTEHSRRSRHDSAAEVPLPASRAETEYSKRDRYASSAGVPTPASRAEAEHSRRSRQDSALGVPLPESRAPTEHSRRSRRDSAAGVPLPESRAATEHSRRSRRDSAAGIPLPESRAPTEHSRRSRRDSAAGIPLPESRAATEHSRRSKHDSAAEVPVPASRAATEHSKRDKHATSAAGAPTPAPRAESKTSRPSHHSNSAARIPLPTSTRAPSSYVSAAQIPTPKSMTGSAFYEDPPSDRDPASDDGMEDMCTVVPDDSISCADFSSRGESRKSGKRGKVGSEGGGSRFSTGRRGDFREKAAEGVGRSGRSAVTLPVRRGRERKRSFFSYA